jgi:streptomycin 6-kinase
MVAAAGVPLRAAGARRAVLARPLASLVTPSQLAPAIERWGIKLAAPFPDVYPGNLVYRCTLPNGTAAVVKYEPDRGSEDEFLTEVDALEMYAGRGMVRLLEILRDERIVLMELVAPGEPLWDAPIDHALEAIASVMARLRRSPPGGHSFPDVRAYRRAWPNHRRLYGGAGPIDRDLFEMGERLFVDLCDSSGEPVVLHGDLHYGNVLRSDRDGWLAIDPKGVIGEPCYETGDVLRNRIDELYDTRDAVAAMRRRIEMLAELTGFDGERIRRWGLAQAVLSEVWSADDPTRATQVDLRAARLLRDIRGLGADS